MLKACLSGKESPRSDLEVSQKKPVFNYVDQYIRLARFDIYVLITCIINAIKYVYITITCQGKTHSIGRCLKEVPTAYRIRPRVRLT